MIDKARVHPNTCIIYRRRRRVQACVLGDPSQPLTRQQLADAQERTAGVADLAEVLPQVYDLVNCAFIDSAFTVIIAEECDSLDDDSYGLAAAAFIAAISLTLTTFYFCICIQCAPPPPPAPALQPAAARRLPLRSSRRCL